jgi:hypothetical protein
MDPGDDKMLVQLCGTPTLKYDDVVIGQSEVVVHAESFGSLGVMMVGMEAMPATGPNSD